MQVHNFYRSSVPSGENVVVEREATDLEAAGVLVHRYWRRSDEIASLPASERLTLPLRPFRSGEDVREVSRLLTARKIDLMHIHNVNPLISWSVVDAAVDAGVPVVATAHNHRLSCLKGTHWRDGRPCHDCRGRALPWPGVAHACYRGSAGQSAVVALSTRMHRPTQQRISRHIAVSEAMRQSLLATGVEDGRIVVKPHSVVGDPSVGRPAPASEEGGLSLLWVGRLEEQKGFELLMQAWAGTAPAASRRLAVIGSGPLRHLVEDLAAARSDVTFLGQRPQHEVRRALAASHALLVPSLCEESFGLVAAEAFAAGRPVVTTGAGGLADVVTAETGWLVPAAVDAWRSSLEALEPQDCIDRGKAARRRYEECFEPSRVTSRLLRIYQDVLGESA